jgi:hypothetical protein
MLAVDDAASTLVAPAAPKPRRGRKARPRVDAKALTGRTYLHVIQQYLADLRQLYPHPNRVLFYDDVVVAYLLAFFNPTLRSLRCIEDASQVPGVNQFLSVEAVCKSTLSEANALFDPQHLQGLMRRLGQDLPNLHQIDPQLSRLLEHVRIFDGSYFRVAADVAWALHQRKPDDRPMGQVRLNCQFCLRTGCVDVEGVSVSGDDGIGEGAAATPMIQDNPGPAGPDGPDGPDGTDGPADAIYLFDSGVVKFSYLRAILEHGGHFLCNLREHIHFDAIDPEREQRPLSDADRAAGVISDRIGQLRSSHAPRGADAAPKFTPLREVRVAYTDRAGKAKQLRLLTDLLDLPAHVIAELYRHRWQIELFFRWLKVHANFRHLTVTAKTASRWASTSRSSR